MAECNHEQCNHTFARAPVEDALVCSGCGVRISGIDLRDAATRIRSDYEERGVPILPNHLASIGGT